MTDHTNPLSKIHNLSFEDALERLEDIVSRLEAGGAPLDQMVKDYEEGMRLKQHCEEKLKQANMRVEKVLEETKGNPSTTSPLAKNKKTGRWESPS